MAADIECVWLGCLDDPCHLRRSNARPGMLRRVNNGLLLAAETNDEQTKAER